MNADYRRPESVLVVVHTATEALLLRRRRPFAFWQSVTGSLKQGETHAEAALRELIEETGITDTGPLEFTGRDRTFVIDPRWRHRFGPGVTENLEHEWRYRLDETVDIRLSAAEHSEYVWLPFEEAAAKVWSWTNREALETLLP